MHCTSDIDALMYNRESTLEIFVSIYRQGWVAISLCVREASVNLKETVRCILRKSREDICTNVSNFITKFVFCFGFSLYCIIEVV